MPGSSRPSSSDISILHQNDTLKFIAVQKKLDTFVSVLLSKVRGRSSREAVVIAWHHAERHRKGDLMMRRYALAGVVALAFSGAAQAATAPTINFTNGVYTIPSFTTAAVFEEFEGGVNGTQYTGAVQRDVRAVARGYTESSTGNTLALGGNVPGDGFSPDPDNNTYLAVQAGGLFTVNLGAGATVFSFVFGTLDTYNTLRLFFNDTTSQLFTGRELIGLANNQSNPSTYAGVTGRVTYDTGGQSLITSAQFGSTGFDAFEIDSLAAAVPEPAAWAMMVIGFGLAGAALRTRRRKVTFAAA